MQSFDCVVIATNHSTYDWNWIIKHSNRILDTRNATADIKDNRSNVVKL